MTQDPLEEKVGGGGEAHRGSGVTRSRLLHGVHRQGSYDVDRLPVKVTPLKACAAQLLDPLLFFAGSGISRPQGTLTGSA
ncbi:hypothetical protein GCM10010116_49240 [Microbispora rosea subsp. aerata]|nr:hypothetical protein GCM10010116_49240 [Microbispora rosea subsp. aerata]GIH58040.1 hypothetical protein Mro02_49540 [Microbispora rosea subsp. aerata]GLJ82195.1 hypothetical protein GCM10017588_09200 [Microbispora rosea subsp. aerata]